MLETDSHGLQLLIHEFLKTMIENEFFEYFEEQVLPHIIRMTDHPQFTKLDDAGNPV